MTWVLDTNKMQPTKATAAPRDREGKQQEHGIWRENAETSMIETEQTRTLHA